jgi:hypothetical protein
MKGFLHAVLINIEQRGALIVLQIIGHASSVLSIFAYIRLGLVVELGLGGMMRGQ